MTAQNNEIYISVDVETAGPNPGTFALLSIGACLADDPDQTFYVELQPDKNAFQSEALAISGLKLDELAKTGQSPKQAMQAFADWVAQVTPPGGKAIFVAFNAPFDWMFVAEYFHRYLGHNPFGHSALDMKAFFMGLRGVAWGETGMDAVSEALLGKRSLSHNALQDALDQAELFREMLRQARDGKSG